MHAYMLKNTAEWTLLEATKKNEIRIVKLGETVNCLSIDYLLNALCSALWLYAHMHASISMPLFGISGWWECKNMMMMMMASE